MLNFDNFSIILFILPVYQMMFYSVQLFTLRKNRDPSRRPLGFLMLLMLLYLVLNGGRYLGYNSLFKYLSILQLPILLAILPTYYFYLNTILGASERVFSKPGLARFLPSIFILLLNAVAFVNLSPGQTDFFLSPKSLLSVSNDQPTSFVFLIFLLANAGFISVQFFFTVFFYLRMNRKLIHDREKSSAFLPHFQNTWSHIIASSVTGFVIAGSLMNILSPAYNHYFSAVFNTGMLIFGGLAGFFSLKQDKLFMQVASMVTEKDKIDIGPAIVNRTKAKGRNIPTEKINPEEAGDIISRLKQHLAVDKPYLNSKLRVVDLAKNIGTSDQKLTYVINNVMETNFYGIINKYRVLEAKEMLKRSENQHYNIDVISEMVGFQSKSSFNGCFKKMTGFTPSEFRKYNGK